MVSSHFNHRYRQRFESVSRKLKIPVEVVRAIALSIQSNVAQGVMLHLTGKVYEQERRIKDIERFISDSGLSYIKIEGTQTVRYKFVIRGDGLDKEREKKLNSILELDSVNSDSNPNDNIGEEVAK